MRSKFLATASIVALSAMVTPSVAQASSITTSPAANASNASTAITEEQIRFLERIGKPTLDEISRTQAKNSASRAFPIAAVAIGAAAWCAKGALASVPTSVIDDVANGGEGTDYVRNAIIGCIGGEIGGFVWKVLPGAVKKKAVELVAAFIIKYIR
ncbi:hypothetical protein [Demetria terragena]|uniref:hypothetical protein n=1 Tax=Demetria terragena TaxID=63959 RepID=UPI0003689E3A|nr:hypothetical protein [Demetria terragena]